MPSRSYRWPTSLRQAPQLVGIGPEMFEDIERFIEDNRHSQRRFNRGINVLAMLLAEKTRGEAQKLSRGRLVMTETGKKSSPTKWNPARRPFGYPVDRWTGEYFKGWKTQYVGIGKYMCYNDSGHAVFVELGINPRSRYAGFRRRPVMKLSVRNMLRGLQGTRTLERFTYDVFRGGPGESVRVY